MAARSQANKLEAGLREMTGLDPDARLIEKLLNYLDLLEHWNRAYNLTAVKGQADMITRHLLDSLSILPWIGSGNLLDAGTGAGLPGIPLALARPDLEVILLDSSGKKIRFLNHVRRAMGLSNVIPIQVRLESFFPDVKFERIVSRAFTDLASFAQAARRLAAAPSRILAMKGRYPESELKVLPEWLRVDSIEKLSVPGLQEDRHLVIMSVIA